MKSVVCVECGHSMSPSHSGLCYECERKARHCPVCYGDVGNFSSETGYCYSCERKRGDWIVNRYMDFAFKRFWAET